MEPKKKGGKEAVEEDDNVEKSKRRKITGIYAGDLIPGHYLKTHNGTLRGEELFSRPELERPWRSVTKQRHAMQVAMKDEELETLMRLCSDLRTELGNARNDARLVEYAVQEKAKRDLAAKDQEIAAAREERDNALALQKRAKEDTEHQIRLLRAQHESDMQKMKTEVRLTTERMMELRRAFDKQVTDIKEIAAREVQLMETRFNVKVEELTAELTAARASAAATEAHLREQLAQSNLLLSKVEGEYKERARAAEANLEAARKAFDHVTERERREKEAAQKEVRSAAERLAAAVVDADEVSQRFKLWNQFILSALDSDHVRFAETCPEHVAEVHDPRQHELPPLYTPRPLQHDAEAKLAVERVVLRLLEMETRPIFPDSSRHREELLGRGGVSELEAENIADRQKRLRSGFRELEERCRDLESTCTALRSRLCFFSDDLQQAVTTYPQVSPPPPHKATFVCLAVFEGNQLWANYPEHMHTAMTYFHSTLRTKKQEYGAYECYSDGVCVLLALEDPIAACRLAMDVQEWCLNIPWPEALLKDPHCSVVTDRRNVLACSTATGKTLFRGLRIGAAIHAGPCHLEHTAMPESRLTGSATLTLQHSPDPCRLAPSAEAVPETEEEPGDAAFHKHAASKTQQGFRRHFYGKAVLQTIHICSLAQGGQILVSQHVWTNACQPRKHELVSLAVATLLGRYAVLSLNAQLGQDEHQTMELYQILPKSLAQRTFTPTSVLLQQANRRSKAGGAVGASSKRGSFRRPSSATGAGPEEEQPMARGLIKGLEKVKNFTVAVGIAGLESQHAGVREGLQLLRSELRDVHDKAGAMVEMARRTKAQFHLLPPPEMVLQLNELYVVLEDVASMSDETAEDMKQLEVAQDELRAAVQGLREYLFRFLSDGERESQLKVEHEVALNRLEGVLKEVQNQRKQEVELLTLAVEERDQMLRKIYQDQQQQQPQGTAPTFGPKKVDKQKKKKKPQGWMIQFSVRNGKTHTHTHAARDTAGETGERRVKYSEANCAHSLTPSMPFLTYYFLSIMTAEERLEVGETTKEVAFTLTPFSYPYLFIYLTIYI
eukprot:gene8820-6204_t